MARRGTLHVGRHVVRTRVAKGGSGGGVAASLGDALTHALGERLPAMALPGGDECVWLIRRLDVRAAVSGAWTASRMADALAKATVGALSGALRRGADGDTVVWFPDRAAFLGRFLVDLVDGRAAGRWEYGELAGAARRPRSGAVAEIVRREPGTALAALVRLAPADLRRLLATLTPGDAASVLAALAELTGPRASDPAPLAVEALCRLLERSDLPRERRSAALALFVEVARVEAPVPPAGTDARARDLAVLAAALADGSADPALAAAVSAGDWRRVAAAETGRLAGFASWPDQARRDAVDLLARARSGAPGRGGGADVATLTTDLGGMFLLLPLLEELPWQEATTTWPDLDGVPAERLLRYLAVIGALGAGRNVAAVRDPVLRLALGMPDGVDGPALGAWTTTVGPGPAREATEAWAASLHRRGKVSGEVTLAPLGDGVVAVDGARGIWLGTAPAAPASIRELVASVEAAFGRPLATAASEPWIEACLEPGRPPPDPIDGRLLARLGDQARHAAVGPPLAPAPHVDEVVMLAAQALARELAWRLPGFSRSSLPYLRDNVLDFGASVTVEPERFVVAVGDPPLHLLLSLAGVNRRRFRLAATGEREWTLARAR